MLDRAVFGFDADVTDTDASTVRPVVAAVDIGTNSIRLLVARRGVGMAGLGVLARRMRIVRLGQSVDQTGRLAEEAIERTAAALVDYTALWRGLNAGQVRITATSAVRDAKNAHSFVQVVQAITGLVPEVLTGQEEAALAFAGAAAGLTDVARPILVLDIGGGSTELIRGSAAPVAATSRDIGSVRLTERCLPDAPAAASQIADAKRIITTELDVAASVVDPSAATSLVGTAGTITTVAALHLGLDRYEPDHIHGARMPAAAVHEWSRRLLAMTVEQRQALGPMAPGRADVIGAGALILSVVVERFGFGEVHVSEADILDGLALSQL